MLPPTPCRGGVLTATPCVSFLTHQGNAGRIVGTPRALLFLRLVPAAVTRLPGV